MSPHVFEITYEFYIFLSLTERLGQKAGGAGPLLFI